MAKKYNKNNIKKNRIIFIILCLVVIVALGYLIKFIFDQKTGIQNMQSTTKVITDSSQVTESKKYYSELLEASIVLPDEYSVVDELGSVTLTNINNGSEILFSKIGTNNDSLDGYLYGIANYNNYVLTNKVDLVIDSHPALKVDINGDTTYLIYVKSNVYYFETKNPELYSDLDQIARSFRYEP